MYRFYTYQVLVLHLFYAVTSVQDDKFPVDAGSRKHPANELPTPIKFIDFESNSGRSLKKLEKTRKLTMIDVALQIAAKEGIDAVTDLIQNIEPQILHNGQVLKNNHPAALLSKFSAPAKESEQIALGAYATLTATKAFRRNFKELNVLGRQAQAQKISFRRTPLEGLCPPREPPECVPASQRYRTHDGTCNNRRRLRWGAAQMPFNRFLPPEYGDGVDSIRGSVAGGPLSSARFVSLLVHGAQEGDAPLTLLLVQWGQLLDHDMTSTAQPRSINGSVPSCCGISDFHPSCFPIKVPLDDPWLAPLKVRCLEFLRSAPAQRRDCVLSWREQTNQVTSFIDASPIYSSSAKMSDNARISRNGLIFYGHGKHEDDICMRGALARHCIRSGDGRSGEQPGLLALHHVWVGEHNRIAMELSQLNPHWSDEKTYQEARRIVGALFQHITYNEFLPIVLGQEVGKLFDLELLSSGYFTGYDPNINPSVANSFAASAFRFGHSLVPSTYMRCDRNHNFINNNVSLHEEFQRGDIGTPGSLHRLIRGLAAQRALKRDEFITPELTNHLFQTPGFPFGLDLAAINIQRGRDHGIAPYTAWRKPCGLSPINSWDELANIVGPESATRISHAYRSVHDIDLFVGGIAERPVIGGLVGPTFACIIAQQFSNSRKGDRFWYENGGFESSFTPAQLYSLRRVSFGSVLCRTVGTGTFQPHVFVPSDVLGNERVPCGKGSLAPIDLLPWSEQDPLQMINKKEEGPIVQLQSHAISLSTDITKGISTIMHNITKVAHVDFIPNSSIGFHRVPNMTKIHDKLDLVQKVVTRPVTKPIEGISNKLDKRRMPIKKQSKPVISGPSKKTDTTKVDTEQEAFSKVQKIKKKKTEIQKDVLALATQNTIFRVAGVVRSQMNPIESVNPTIEQGNQEIFTELNNNRQEKMNPEISNTMSSNYTDLRQPYADFQALINTVLAEPADVHIRSHRSLPFNTVHLEEVNVSSSLDFADKLRTLESGKPNQTLPRQLTNRLSVHSPELKPSHVKLTGLHNVSRIIASNVTLEIPESGLEAPNLLRQFQERPIYNRPQKVMVDGDTSDQYEIEINIRQTPKGDKMPFVDRNIPNRYISNQQQLHTPTSYTPSQKDSLPIIRTKPPTIIYINEHDEPSKTSSKTAGILQSIASFASNAFNSNKEQTGYPSNPLQQFANRIVNAGLNIEGTGQTPTPSNYLNSPQNQLFPQLKPVSTNFVGGPQINPFVTPQNFPPAISPPFNQNQGGQPDLPSSPTFPSFGIPETSSFSTSSNSGGVSHASSSAVSSGYFGTIAGSAASAGSDSTFSFNIRPSSRPQPNLIPNAGFQPNYEILPQRQSSSTPSYARPPKPILTSGASYYPPNKQDTLFSHDRRPPPSYYNDRQTNSFQPTNVFERSELKIDENGTISNETNGAQASGNIDKDDYDYESFFSNENSEEAREGNNDMIEDQQMNTFGTDCYLRPEFMAANLNNKSSNQTDLNKTCHNFVFPVVLPDNETLGSLQKEQTEPKVANRDYFPDTMQDSLKNLILADDYEVFLASEKRASDSANLRHSSKVVTSAPIKVNILDNWGMLHTTSDRPLMPILPDDKAPPNVANELPKPFGDMSGIILTISGPRVDGQTVAINLDRFALGLNDKRHHKGQIDEPNPELTSEIGDQFQITPPNGIVNPSISIEDSNGVQIQNLTDLPKGGVKTEVALNQFEEVSTFTNITNRHRGIPKVWIGLTNIKDEGKANKSPIERVKESNYLDVQEIGAAPQPHESSNHFTEIKMDILAQDTLTNSTKLRSKNVANSTDMTRKIQSGDILKEPKKRSSGAHSEESTTKNGNQVVSQELLTDLPNKDDKLETPNNLANLSAELY